MRPELNEIQYIEQYLKGKLDSTQRLAFEKKLIADSAFKEKVELQQLLMQGIENRAIRNSVAEAYGKAKFKSKLKLGLGVAFIVAVIVTGILFIQNLTNFEGSFPNENENLEDKAELVIPSEQQAGNSLETQFFRIKGNRDTVIQTIDGIVLAIEAGTFVDQEGSAVGEEIKVAIKEALKVEDILSSGLSTVTTSGEVLETGGMFSINAKSGSETLSINPTKGIFTQVPTDKKKPGMKLWEGKLQKDGQVLWDNAKELEQFLIPVDMNLLSFYPKDFEHNIRRLGFPNASKKQLDSIYYSFASHFTKKGRSQFLVVNTPFVLDTTESFVSEYPKFQSKFSYYRYPIKTGLNPAKVKAFWDVKLNGSLLATKEFEKRMHLIHQTGSADILDLYVQNAGKRISEIDLLAAEQSIGKLKKRFEGFAALNEGRVETNSQLVKMLNGFYRQRELSYKNALSKVSSYWKEQQKKDKGAQKLIKKFNEKEAKRVADNFITELQDNLDTVYRQLGYKSGPRVSYTASVRSTGWNNIDKQVYSATAERTSTTFEENGKTAKLSYSELRVFNDQKFDRVYGYVLTPSLPSFQRMNYCVVDTEFVENEIGEVFPYPISAISLKINDFYRYGFAMIGYRGDSCFTYFESALMYDSVLVGKNDSVRIKNVVLKSQSENNFFKRIKRFSGNKSFKTDLKKDLLFQRFFQEEKIRKVKLQELVSFRREVQEYVFPRYYLCTMHYLRNAKSVQYSGNLDLKNMKHNNFEESISFVAVSKKGSAREGVVFDDFEEVLFGANGFSYFTGERIEYGLNSFQGYGNFSNVVLGVENASGRSISSWDFINNGDYSYLSNDKEGFTCVNIDFELVSPALKRLDKSE